MMGELPEVTALRDARGERPANAGGAGEFWYEPEIWTLPVLSPTARVLYAGLCSYVGHGEINRHDLRNTLKDHTDDQIAGSFGELVRHDLLQPDAGGVQRGYAVRSVREFEPC